MNLEEGDAEKVGFSRPNNELQRTAAKQEVAGVFKEMEKQNEALGLKPKAE